MAVELSINERRSSYIENETDPARVRVFPIEIYEPWTKHLPKIAKLATEYHFLRVPLLGQQYKNPALGIDEDNVFCGRTSVSIVYNYFQLIKGGDAKSRYVTHWRYNQPDYLFDLRFANGQRAFITKAEDIAGIDEHGRRIGIAVADGELGKKYVDELPVPLELCYPTTQDPQLASRTGLRGIVRYGEHSPAEHLFPIEKADNDYLKQRRKQAEDIAKDKAKLDERFKGVLTSLRGNNPVMFHGALGNPHRGGSGTEMIHYVVFSGYCYLKDADDPKEPQLWLLVANPATRLQTISGLVAGSFPKDKDGGIDAWKGPQSKETAISLIDGEWDNAKGSLCLLRASVLFQHKPDHPHPEGLYMDYYTLSGSSFDIGDAGGGYLSRQTRTTVPCEMVRSSLDQPRFICPLDAPGDPPNLWRQYCNNENAETGIGGYYLVGLRRNLHGGIHVFPPAPAQTPVRAMAPGYIVAARLPGIGAPCLDKAALQHVGCWPGFVIIRHEATEKPSDPNTKPRTGCFYSLYMHLVPPKLSKVAGSSAQGSTPPAPATINESDAYFTVPWFRSLIERRFGAFVRVSDEPPPPKSNKKDAPPLDAAPLGTLLWSTEQVEVQSDGKPKNDEYVTIGSGGAKIKLRAGAKTRWLYKPSPAKLVDAVNALAEGQVVTFGDPLFPINAGDLLGFVAPLPKEAGGEAVVIPCLLDGPGDTQYVRRLPYASGFLHWQVFAPEGEGAGGRVNGIELLVELAKKVTEGVTVDPSLPKPKAPELTAITDDGDNNFLDASDIENKLKPALPKADQNRFAEAFKHLDESAGGVFGYAPEIIGLLDSKTSFAPKATSPDWEAGCKFGYPMLLQIELDKLPPPDKNTKAGGKYTLEFEFLRVAGGNAVGITCGPGCNQQGCGDVGSNDTAPSAGGDRPQTCKPKPFVIDAGLFNAKKKDGLLSFTLRVPAQADRVRVTPGPGLVGESANAPKGSDLLLLADALKARWRHVSVKQVNEWSKKSFEAIAKEVKEHHVVDPKVIDVAWCDDKKEKAIGRQVLVLGSGGLLDKVIGPTPLFSSQKGMIAVDGKIECLHPVTAVWLLNALEKNNKLVMAESWPVAAFQHGGLEPATVAFVIRDDQGPLLLGDPVSVVVVDDDFGYDQTHAITLIAEGGGKKLELAHCTYDKNGLIVTPLRIGFWGDFTIRTLPAEKPGKELFGTKTLSIPALQLDAPTAEDKALGLNQPQRLENGKFSWVVKVKTQVREIEGVIAIQTKKSDAAWAGDSAREHLVLPTTARGVAADVQKLLGEAPKNLDLLVVSNGFIVGVNEEAAKQNKKKPAAVEISDGMSYGKYTKAYTDINLACSLIDTLQEIRESTHELTVTHIDENGLWLKVRLTAAPKKPKGKGTPPPADTSLLDAATKVVKSKKGMSAAADADKPEEVVLRLDASSLMRIASCPRLNDYAKNIVTDETGLYVRDCNGQNVVKNSPFSELKAAYSVNGRFRVNVALAKALHAVRKKVGDVSIAWLSFDGLSCDVASALEKTRGVAVASGLFSLVELRKGKLRLRVLPDPEHYVSVNFDPTPLFQYLAVRGDIQPGAHLDYRFFFETLNGMHFLTQGNEGSCPFHGPSVLKSKLDELEKRAPGKKLVSAPSETAGSYSKLVFKNPLTFTWTTVGVTPYLFVNIELQGVIAEWGSYRIKVSRKSGTNAFKVIKGAEKLAPPKEGNSLRVMLPVLASDKDFDKTIDFKVEAVAVEKVQFTPPPVESSYNCEPRWLEAKLDIDDTLLGSEIIVRCAAAGVELPEYVNGQEKSGKAAREFELDIAEITPPLATTPPSTTTSKAKKTKPEKFMVFYAHKNLDGSHGYLDENGVFEARVPLAPRADEARMNDPQVRSLRPGGKYKLTLRRPSKWKVRNTTLDERIKDYFFEAGCKQCPFPDENYPYSERTFKYIAQIRALVLEHSAKLGVPPIAVAGSIADEYNTQTGAKGVVDFVQDNALLNWMPNSWIELDAILNFDTKLLNATKHDIGTGNIKLETAKFVYEANKQAFVNRNMIYSQLVDYLRTDAGTVHLASLVIQQGQTVMDDYLLGCSPKKREAILVTYYKQGAAMYLGRYKKKLQSDPTRRLQAGEGCRVCLQRARFQKELGI